MEYIFAKISIFLLILTALIAVMYYKKYKLTPIKYLPYYLGYAVILEVVANLLRNYFGLYNTWWYNIGINVEILFYLYLYYKFTDKIISKKIILYGGIIYEIYYLINYLIAYDWNASQKFPFTIGGILIIIIVFRFLIEMFQSDKILYFHKYLIFWISIGLLFYNIIPLPFFVVRDFFSISSSGELKSLIYTIQFSANLLMYLSFIYGFIWSTKSYKSN